MIPRIPGTLPDPARSPSRLRVALPARLEGGQDPRVAGLGERGRGGVLVAQHPRQVRGPGDAERGVQGVHTVLGTGAVRVVAQVDDGAVGLESAEPVPEALGDEQGTALAVVEAD